MIILELTDNNALILKHCIIERINKINFVDINYAVLIKAVVENNSTNYTQSWVQEQAVFTKPKLLQACNF